MICMLTVPASMTSRDLLEFVSAYESWIESMKIIKDSTPNKYMVLTKFKNQVNNNDYTFLSYILLQVLTIVLG